MDYHIPVLLHESIEGLNVRKDGIYVDLTYGGGGHSAAILRNITSGRLFAFDQDRDAPLRHEQDERVLFIRHNFRYLSNFLKYYGVEKVDGMLADLGVSSHQFDFPGRGFSFRHRALLDMRMNTGQKKTARDILNSYTLPDLQRVFRDYGEIGNAGRLVKVIGEYRTSREILYTDQFVELIRTCIPARQENKFLARVFQALRIEVNDEVESLKELLLQSVRLIRPGGRMVVISYHSIEDRMVKNFFRAGNMEGRIEKDLYGNFTAPYRPVNNRVIVPGENEIQANSRARSARLRIAERTDMEA